MAVFSKMFSRQCDVTGEGHVIDAQLIVWNWHRTRNDEWALGASDRSNVVCSVLWPLFFLPSVMEGTPTRLLCSSQPGWSGSSAGTVAPGVGLAPAAQGLVRTLPASCSPGPPRPFSALGPSSARQGGRTGCPPPLNE